MQSNQNQKMSFKDKITSHLPGHKNQDNNANGVPDRLEKNTAANTGHRTLSDKNGNGVPDRLERGSSFGTAAPLGTTGYQGTGLQSGLGSYGTGLSGQQFQSGLGYQQGGFSQDLNQNGIPDSLERSGSYGTGLGYQQGFSQDLNRNGIPDQLEASQGFGFVGSVPAVQSSVVDVRQAPVIVEKVERPAVVHEVYKTEEVVQIQPIIERERDQLDVYEVVQPIREREVIATEVREAVLPAQTRAAIVQDNSAFLAARSAPSDFSTREVAATQSQVIENAPIIHETIVHKVIEEVQPVIYKEVDRPILIKETLPIYEKIVEAPHAHKTVLPMRDLGVRSVTTTTGFTDLNRDGIPDQLQGGMYQTTGLQSGLQSQGFISQPGLSGQQFQGTGLQSGYGSGYQSGLSGQQFQGTGLGYQQGGFSQDLNQNGIPDSLERSGSYGTGLQSGYGSGLGYQQGGLAQGGLTDFNQNGVPDQYEQGSFGQQQGLGLQGGLNDRNMNGIPDNLEGRRAPRTLSDLNGNGVPDRMEKGHGLKDLNGNGVDDSLERRMGNTSLNANTRV